MNTNLFWSWFLANEKKLRSIHTLPEIEGKQLLFWFYQYLRCYSADIGFQILIKTSSKKRRTLTFFTSGDSEAHQIISNLIQSAPKIPNWIISTTVETLSEDDSEYLENEFNINKASFITSNIKSWIQHIDPVTNKLIVGIILNFPTANINPEIAHLTVVRILKEILGDYIYNHRIENIIIHNQLPNDKKVFELRELKLYLEGY
ncbi:hypothetical protein [Aequorivita viscosa]|uniref:Uncharacterized protein n=1 Tax=Aequorivita viscosa TaxID=797419 RepID=A0A1M6MG97_9FLAO|nr:hypothetical protein [Aequorivita viscosa]SDX33455.1 hypothetical protein SAMN05216556_12517 [Aequorivita viscosa]SHJ82492.1 hypothetical protein SAMN04487908_12715 [Aequorivita viscosa]